MKKRLLLKISGEVLAGGDSFGVSSEVCKRLSQTLFSLVQQGHSLAVVVGGGNFIRGAKEESISRVEADQMGMLATVMNGIALNHYLSEVGAKPRLLSAIPCSPFVESYTYREAIAAYDAGQVVLFVGGTGNPFFTTDSGAALRACELQADLLLKATKVDGVYTKDPKKYPEATRFSKISFTQVLEQNLQVMDATAFTLCSSEKIPILVFSIDLLLQGKEVNLEALLQAGSLVQ